MAKYTNPFSPFYGRIGNITGSSWKGIPYIKSGRPSIKRPPTDAQLSERMKFRLLIKFVTALRSLLMITFDTAGLKMTAINRAHSYNRPAIMGMYPAFMLDYSKMLISVGSLIHADNPATSVADGIIQFTWRNNTGAFAGRRDACIMVAYCPELNQCIYSIGPEVREDGSGMLNVQQFKNKLVHTWMCFKSATEVSTSIYTNSLIVS